MISSSQASSTLIMEQVEEQKTIWPIFGSKSQNYTVSVDLEIAFFSTSFDHNGKYNV